jgi:hypothetical protein
MTLRVKGFYTLGWKTSLTLYGKAVALNMPHQKLIRVLNYVCLLVVSSRSCHPRRRSRPQCQPWD